MASGTTRPVRVVFVSSHAQPGGSERYLELLLGALEPGWVAGVVCLEDGPLVERLRTAGLAVEVVHTPARLGVLPAALRLRRALRRLRPEVVHANGVKAAFVSALATRARQLPVIWVKHDFSWEGRLTRMTARMCAEVVGVSRAVLEGVPGRTSVVPNGLPALAADAARGRQALGEGEAVLLLGRLNRVKGQLELVEAALAVLALRPGVRFFLVGGEDPNERDYAEAVRGRIAALGLGERVHLLGHRDDALDLLAAADVAAVPSGPNVPGLKGEGFGLVALEAMQAGTPVVGWRAGALPEVVGDAGVLVTPGDRAALAESIAELLADPSRREQLAAAGRERAREFTVQRVAEAMRERYAALVR